MSLAEPVPLSKDDIDAAAGVLVRSFADDPGLLFVLPEAEERSRLVPTLARTVLHYALLCGAPLVTSGDIRGAALWFPPNAPPPTAAQLEVTGISAAPGLLGPSAFGRLNRLLDHVDAFHPLHAPDPHWYLAMLGVDPIWQRIGIGEALMGPVFAAADRDGLCCYLEAPTASNADYYGRRGFDVIAETDIPDSDVHIWMMRRDPKTSLSRPFGDSDSANHRVGSSE